MAFQPVFQTVQVAIRAQYLGESCVNTLNFQAAGAYDLAAAQSLAVLVGTDWLAGFMAEWLSPEYVLNEIHVRGLENLNDFEWTEGMGNVPGGATGNAKPGNVAWAVKFISGLTGRSARGRNFISGWTDTGVVGNSIGADTAADVVATYEAISEDAAVLGWTHVVTSRYTEGVKRTSGVNFPIAAITYTDLFVDSQRKRLAGRGA